MQLPPNYLDDFSAKLKGVEQGQPVTPDLLKDVTFVAQTMAEANQPNHPVMRQLKSMVQQGTPESGKIANAVVEGVQTARPQEVGGPQQVQVKRDRDWMDWVGTGVNVIAGAFFLDGIFGGWGD